MCYSNCPFEKVGNPETAGECEFPKMQNTPRAHCYEVNADDFYADIPDIEEGYDGILGDG